MRLTGAGHADALRCLAGRRLPFKLVAAAAITVLSGCAAVKDAVPPGPVAAAEEAQPLPPGVKPLTVEQEENVAAE